MAIYGDKPINPPARRFTPQEIQGALDEIIEGRMNFNTPVRGPKNTRPTLGNRPWQQKNGPTLGQPILDNVLELLDAPNTQSASSVCPTSGRIPWQQTVITWPVL